MQVAAYPLIPATTKAQAITTRITVEVALYSGRPNPVFALSPGEAAELERRIGALPTAADGPPVEDGLGYGGLRVTADDGGFRQVVIANGVVEIRDRAGVASRRADPGQALERWLIAAGAPHLSPDQRGWLEQQVSR